MENLWKKSDVENLVSDSDPAEGWQEFEVFLSKYRESSKTALHIFHQQSINKLWKPSASIQSIGVSYFYKAFKNVCLVIRETHPLIHFL
jgi:hypothetical protein